MKWVGQGAVCVARCELELAGCTTLLVTVFIASVGEALPEIIQSIPKDSDSRLYGVEACSGGGVERDTQKESPLSNYQKYEIPLQVLRKHRSMDQLLHYLCKEKKAFLLRQKRAAYLCTE